MVAAETVVVNRRRRRECGEGRRRVAVWGLRTEMTKGKVRIPMSPGQ